MEPKRYEYGCKMLTSNEICALHPQTPKRSWVDRRLRQGKKVYEILAEPVLSMSAAASKNAKKNAWGSLNFRSRQARANITEAEAGQDLGG